MRPLLAQADAGDIGLAFGPAYAAVDFDSRTPSGVAFESAFIYGLSDAFAARIEAVASFHPTDSNAQLPSGTLTVVGGFAGLRYAFDLVRTIPYLDLGLGVLAAQGAGTTDGVRLAYDAALGFDHLLTPRFAWGLVVSYHAFITDFSRLPIYLYAGPRLSFRWN